MKAKRCILCLVDSTELSPGEAFMLAMAYVNVARDGGVDSEGFDDIFFDHICTKCVMKADAYLKAVAKKFPDVDHCIFCNHPSSPPPPSEASPSGEGEVKH